MARKVETKKGKDGGKYRIIYDDGKPSLINQKIVVVGKDMLKVKSQKGREYWVTKSDRVLTMNPEVGDVAVVGTFDSGWLCTDIIKHIEDDDNKDIQKQLDEFENLLGGY